MSMPLFLNRNERKLRRVMMFWGAAFAVVGTGFIIPAAAQGTGRRADLFALLNNPLAPRRKRVSRKANDREDFWLVLAMSNMALITVFSAMIAANPRKYKNLCIPLLISKANSGLLYAFFYSKTGRTPYLIGAFADLTPFLSILSAYAKTL